METARRRQFIWICAAPALFALGALQFFRGELRRRTRDSRGFPHLRQVKAGVAHVPRALAKPGAVPLIQLSTGRAIKAHLRDFIYRVCDLDVYAQISSTGYRTNFLWL